MGFREKLLAWRKRKWAKTEKIRQNEIQFKALKNLTRASEQRPRLSTSKLLILFLFINSTLIEIFAGYCLIRGIQVSEITALPVDFTPLVALIGSAVSETIGYAVYSLKSLKENTTGGIVFEKALAQLRDKNLEEEGVG